MLVMMSYILVMFMLLPFLVLSMFFSALARLLDWPTKYIMHDMLNYNRKRTNKKIKSLEQFAKKIEKGKK